jgi:hypothetical protein
MPAKSAVKAYKEERLNCAQSVLRAYQHHCKIDEQEISNAARSGGGRAEGGLCGALHAGLKLIEDETAKKLLRSAFSEKAGSEKCREIRQARRIPCVECVRLAAGLVAEHKGVKEEI